MSQPNFMDFDQFFSEMDNTPKATFVLYGETHELPPSLPASLVLQMVRAQKEYGNGNLPEHIQMEMAFCIFGEDSVDEWSEAGMTVDQLGELIKWASSHYTSAEDVKTTNGKKKR